MVEPSVFFRLGGHRAKYNMKINYLWTKTIVDDYYFPISIGMGVNLNLGKPSKTKPDTSKNSYRPIYPKTR
jgi:hypothetical protein